MPTESDPKITVRLGPDGLRRLEALLKARGIRSKSRCVRQLIDEATPDAPRPRPRRLTEEDLIDLLRERAADGNVSAINKLLEIERQRDPKRAALSTLEQLARQQ